MADRPEIKWTAELARKTFFNFFENAKVPRRDAEGKKMFDENGKPVMVLLAHKYWPSSSVLPHNDDTLLFVNSGMCQFKDNFTGNVQEGLKIADLKRAFNSQKCIRAGGKHNDLKDVGRDSYHHTFFEMLGNWSFGDYFKEEAIQLAWELLVDVYGLEPERLYATYFEGDENLPADEEAKNLWMRYLPPERIIPGNTKDNFWMMAETGPCGPCSELHYDKVEGRRNQRDLVNADDPTLIEIWNLVFMSFNRVVKAGPLNPLPNKHIDTGMGFERLVAILQDKMSNYDTDLFTPIFDALKDVIPTEAEIPEYRGFFSEEDPGHIDEAYRVIGDHIRSTTISIADGANPGPNEQDYIVRVMVRRAVMMGSLFLKIDKPFLPDLVDAVVKSLGEVYTNLPDNADRVKSVLLAEEQAFRVTLQRGKNYFDKIRKRLVEEGTTQLSGETVFFMYDTMGFPFECTEHLCQLNNLSVDENDFNARLLEAKERSRSAQSSKGGDSNRLVLGVNELSHLKSTNVPGTNDSPKHTWNISQLAKVTAILVDGPSFVEESSFEDGKNVGLVLDTTSFYSEAGGQVTDTGTIVQFNDNGEVAFKFEVTSVLRFSNYPLHRGKILKGSVKIGQGVECQVNYDRRALIAPNHTFTHVLNWALRDVLGDGVAQRGSEVDPDKLRFDFSHSKPITEKQAIKVSNLCKKVLDDQLQIYVGEGELDLAETIYSLRMDVAEQYPKNVRIVSIGAPVNDLLNDPTNKSWYNYSIEFCGGTHLKNTKEAQAFELIEETACAAGVRRIVAVTKAKATESQEKGLRLLETMDAAEKMKPALKAKPVLLNMKNEMSQAPSVPLTVRMEINKREKALMDRIVKESKDDGDNKAKVAKTKLIESITTIKEQGNKKLIMELDIEGNQKVLSKIMKDDKEVTEKVNGIAVMVFSKTPDGKAVRCAAKSDLDDVDMTAWAQNCCTEAAMDGVKGSARGDKHFANGTMKVKSGDSSVVLAKMMEAAANFNI